MKPQQFYFSRVHKSVPILGGYGFKTRSVLQTLWNLKYGDSCLVGSEGEEVLFRQQAKKHGMLIVTKKTKEGRRLWKLDPGSTTPSPPTQGE